VLDPLSTGVEARPLYRVVLGATWSGLDARLQRFFASGGPRAGRFSVRRGRRALARWLGRMVGLPEAGRGVPLRLVIDVHAGGERWRRDFAGVDLVTEQRALRDDVLAERFRFFEFRFRVDARPREVQHRQIGAALVLGSFRLPLPGWLAPRIAGRMYVVQGDATARVVVSLTLPVAGFVMAYAGTIASEGAPS
jgi:Domain of unknown function (DUF4166)